MPLYSMLQVLSGGKAETTCSPRSYLWLSTTSRPTCLPICWWSILIKSLLPPTAGSRSSRRTTLFSRLTVRISLFLSPRLPPCPSRLASLSRSPLSLCAFPHQRFSPNFPPSSTPSASTISLQSCCLSQHLSPSTQRTPQARTCALSCGNSRPNSQHSPLHTFFSRAPWLSILASGGMPVHSALPTRNSGVRWTLLGRC